MSVTIPTNVYELPQFHMIRAHSTFKAGFNSILSRLDDPPTGDLANFLGYCEAWAESIDHHHESEEKVLFPVLSEHVDFSTELAQHEVIHKGLDELLASIRAAKADHSAFDAARLKGMMETLQNPLYEHLDGEVQHIAPPNLKAFDEKTLHNLLDAVEKYAKDNANPFTVLPYMRCHTSPEWKDLWPALPWVLRKAIIPYILAMRHSGYWKYAPYAMS